MIAVIITIMLVSVFAVITLSLTSSSQQQAAVSALDLQSYYAAESGLRYAAMKYLYLENSGAQTNPGDNSADDEKAAFLKNELDGRTFTIPGTNATFSFDVFANWFVVTSKNGTCQLELPGKVPEGFFSLESENQKQDGTLVFGDERFNHAYKAFTGGRLTDDGVLLYDTGPSQADLAPLVGQPAHLAIWSPDYSPYVNKSFGMHNFYLPCSTPGMFPPGGGIVELNDHKYGSYNYEVYYDYTKYNPDTGILTFQTPLDTTTLQPPSNILLRSQQSTIHLTKAITLRVTGSNGQGISGFSRQVNYAIPIGSSARATGATEIVFDSEDPASLPLFVAPAGEPEGPATLDIPEDPIGESYIDPDTGDPLIEWTHPFQMTHLLEREDEGETNAYCHGAALYADTARIDEMWQKGLKLEYDIQMKLGAAALNYAAQGVEFRKRQAGTSTEGAALYEGYGLSLMKYYSPSIAFSSGSAAGGINPGDWIYCQGNTFFNGASWECGTGPSTLLAKAQVEAVISGSGTWAGGTAAGRLLLKNSSLERLQDAGAACAPEPFFTEGSMIVDETGNPLAVASSVDIAPGGFNDLIPDSLKPPGKGSWFHGNVNYQTFDEIEAMDTLDGTVDDNEDPCLLLVLWQQAVIGGVERRRWLAWKDMSDYASVMGSPELDRASERIHHNWTGLVLRINETGKGADKVNEVQVFYSDARRGTAGRAKTQKPYDVEEHRMGYLAGFVRADNAGSGGSPLWPPRNLDLWGVGYDNYDYLTHLEKPEGESSPAQFQWDALASGTGLIDSWDGSGQAVFRLEDDGRLILSDLTTPDSGSYAVNEFALSGHFDGQRTLVYNPEDPPEPASLNFIDVAIRFADQGHLKGGFLRATQY